MIAPLMSVRLHLALVLSTAVVVVLAQAAAAQVCGSIADCGQSFDPCIVVGCVHFVCTFDPRDCSDGDDCTDDTCDRLLGCVHSPHCPNDDLVCNGGQLCVRRPFSGPLCFPLPPPDCDMMSRCSIDSCVEPTGCQHVAVECNDGNPCTVDTCDAGQGCLHAPVAGCCRTGADCPTDHCSTRRCNTNVCTDPAPISCDDRNPSTVDACNPATGCTHTPIATTTTTTVPSTGCRTDAECAPDPDPCTASACGTDHRCVGHALGGLTNLGCICRRPDPAACAGQPLPHAFSMKRVRACAVIQQAVLSTGPRARRLTGRAARLLGKARRIIDAAKHVNAECRTAMNDLLTNGEQRAASAHDQL